MNPASKSDITLSLRELAQLFNSMDPSPFGDRDLDGAAEEFITSSARELPPRQEPELVLLLAVPTAASNANEVEKAVRRYFAKRAAIKRLEFGQLMRRGRLSLGVGLLFLVICLLLGELVAKSSPGAASDILKEGLTIVGWVAMWRPLEICLYDWWPLYEDRRRLDKLARMRVRIVVPEILPLRLFKALDEKRDELTDTAA